MSGRHILEFMNKRREGTLIVLMKKLQHRLPTTYSPRITSREPNIIFHRPQLHRLLNLTTQVIMHFFNLIFAIALTVESASAVTIKNFRSSTCKGNFIQCSNVLHWQCCSGGPSNTGVVTSAEFSGMPPTAVGAICMERYGNACGSVARAASGSRFCIGSQNCRGSFWMDCNYCNKRDIESRDGLPAELAGASAKDSVDADVIAFEDHQFNFDGSVPADAKQKLSDLFEADAGYTDIPQELKKYELKGNQRRGDSEESEIMYLD
ncbi:hypothetical protein F4677DRAFT_438444 [Hypoxylon crocopeplum]|nr:hypothetical protein F4677DRAFT_438444 [Hypoxylon crocopeplum]